MAKKVFYKNILFKPNKIEIAVFKKNWQKFGLFQTSKISDE
jgi:hypothetical protein